MTFTIGRWSGNESPRNVTMAGDTVTFEVDIVPSTANDLNEMKTQRQQLLGLVDNEDEEVVPVTWSDDSTFDGFYRPRSVSVPSNDVMLSTGYLPRCTVTLERLTGYAAANQEVITTNVLRTNGHSLTNSTPVDSYNVGVPSAAADSLLRVPSLAYTAAPFYTAISTATGNIDTFYMEGGGVAVSALIDFSCPPADQYDGGALIEAKYGSTWYPVVGRSIGAVSFANLRISNGLIRVTFSGTTEIAMEVWNGSAWESASETFRLVSGTTFTPQGYWTIYRNGPELVTVAIRGTNSSGKSTGYLSFSLIRGSFVLDVLPSWTVSFAATWRLEATTNTACTSLTGGIYRTSNDASGNRWVLLGAPALTKDTTNGKITLSSAAVATQFGIGMELNGSSSTTYATKDAITLAWFRAHGVRQRMIVR